MVWYVLDLGLQQKCIFIWLSKLSLYTFILHNSQGTQIQGRLGWPYILLLFALVHLSLWATAEDK